MTRAVAFISLQNVLPWGGSEELWSRSARHLLARGWRASAMVYDWPTPARQVAELVAAGCSVHRYSSHRSLASRVAGKLGVAGRDLFSWLGAERPDLAVISLVGHTGGVSESAACRRRGIPYVLVIQAAGEGIWPADEELDRLAESYTGAVAVCFVSEANRRVVERQFGQPLPNARVVRNPFNVRADAALDWPGDGPPFRLACVGRLDPQHKGQDLVIEVLGRPKWRDRALSVTFVGRDGAERRLKRLAEWRGANVRFPGFSTDIEQVWAGHHALILPSRVEGLPLALVEAMVCGRPAIVTDVAGNAEMIEDGVSGFVAPAPTVDLLDDALERAWQRRGDWKAMGEVAGSRIRDLVSADPAAVFADAIEQTAAAVGRR
jgi:glycosyltransferase involved in cell wall biosynthesis